MGHRAYIIIETKDGAKAVYKEKDGWRIVTEAPTLSYLYSLAEELERWGFSVEGFHFPDPIHSDIVEIKVRR